MTLKLVTRVSIYHLLLLYVADNATTELLSWLTLEMFLKILMLMLLLLLFLVLILAADVVFVC